MKKFNELYESVINESSDRYVEAYNSSTNKVETIDTETGEIVKERKIGKNDFHHTMPKNHENYMFRDAKDNVWATRLNPKAAKTASSKHLKYTKIEVMTSDKLKDLKKYDYICDVTGVGKGGQRKVYIIEGLKLREEDYSDIEGMNLYEITVKYYDISKNHVA